MLMVLVLRVIPDEPCPSCSSRCCFRFRHNRKKTAPTIANKPARPPTTPPTIAPVFDFWLPLALADESEVGVTTTVRVTMTPLSVTTVERVMGSSVVLGLAVVLSVVEAFVV